MLSILLAVYNNAEHLQELIDSILAQSYGDFRLYVRDDCSTDNSLAIAGSYTDPRIEVVASEMQSGSAQNNFFRLLLEHEDDYIMFADADDFWLPDKIEKTMHKMKAVEAEYGAETPILIHTNVKVADAKLGIIAESLFDYEKLSPERKGLRELLAQNNVTGCTVMINRALRSLVREKPEQVVMHDWWLALCAAAFGQIGYLTEPTMLYRQHGDNSVGAYNASDPAAAAKKLANTKRTRAVYESMFRQAECFAETYKDTLSPAQYALCKAYGSMLHKGKAGRIAVILKNRFYKNTAIRNIGQLIAI